MSKTMCRLCGSEKISAVFYRDFSAIRNIVPIVSYHVMFCKECGGIFATEICESMSTDEYYASMSKYENDYYRSSLYELNRYEKVAETLDLMLQKDSKILDIGCAAGHFLQAFKKRGYKNVYGLDFSKKNIEYANMEFGIKIYEGGLGKIEKVEGDKYDLITLEHVLEHIVNLNEGIEEIKELLVENGKIHIAVPDAEAFCKKNDYYQQFSTEHVNYFTEESLVNLFTRHGMRCLFIKQDEQFDQIQAVFEVGNSSPEHNEYCVPSKFQKYLDMCKEKKSELEKIISEIRRTNTKYNIWGVGTHTSMMFQDKIIFKDEIECLIDNNLNYQGKKIQEHEVVSWEDVNNNYPIIISSPTCTEDIAEFISKKTSLSNRIVKLYID